MRFNVAHARPNRTCRPEVSHVVPPQATRGTRPRDCQSESRHSVRSRPSRYKTAPLQDKLRRARPSPDRRPAASPSSEPIKFIELQTGKSVADCTKGRRCRRAAFRFQPRAVAGQREALVRRQRHPPDRSENRSRNLEIGASRLRPPWRWRLARRDACRSPCRPGRSPWPSRQ